MKTNKNKKGFTLVELVIVIAVIAILAAVLIPTFITVIGNANKSAAEQEGANVKTEILTLYGGQFDEYCAAYNGITIDTGDSTKIEKKTTSNAIILKNGGAATLLYKGMKGYEDYAPTVTDNPMPVFGDFANISESIVIYWKKGGTADDIKIQYQTGSGYVVTITATGVSAAKGTLDTSSLS